MDAPTLRTNLEEISYFLKFLFLVLPPIIMKDKYASLVEKLVSGAKALCERGKKTAWNAEQDEGLKSQKQAIFVIFTSCLCTNKLHYFTRLVFEAVMVPSQKNMAHC